MEKVLLAKLITSESAITELMYEKLPVEYSEALLKFIEDATPATSEFKNKNNEIYTTKYGIEKDGKWELKPELKDEYQQVTTEMVSKEIELEVPHLSLSKITEFNPMFTISPIALKNLKNFLLYE